MAVKPLPNVVLAGRPNVGKSTLFNRITGTRRAIVTPFAGTTRDVIEQPAEWQGAQFTLVDTGGMFGASTDPLHELVVERGRQALGEADVVIFVVDGREGLVPSDQEIAAALRSRGVPVVVAVNKSDDRRARGRGVEFYQFGFEPIVEIAAEHGDGVGDLLDEVIERLPATRSRPDGEPAASRPKEEPQEIAVAIVGRPNVGKSSLVNRLLREERVMVSDMPGTTRDAVDAVLRWHRQSFRIVDTAGIRRAGRVARTGGVEAISVLIARRAIERADVAVLVLDAVEGAADQDAAIAGEAEKAGCGIIIAANKWDLLKDRGPGFVKEFDEKLRFQLKFLDYAPLLHISARSGERVPRLLETIDRVADARARRIPTGELNRFVEAVTAVHPPASPGRREVRILYAAQTGVKPPTFVFFTNVATEFHFSYERFLQNRLRESFGLTGAPIRILVRRRG
jgi:GTPase